MGEIIDGRFPLSQPQKEAAELPPVDEKTLRITTAAHISYALADLELETRGIADELLHPEVIDERNSLIVSQRDAFRQLQSDEMEEVYKEMARIERKERREKES